MDKGIIKQHNAITEARDDISALERNLVHTIYAQLKDSDPLEKKYTVSIQELQKKLRQLGREINIDQVQAATANLVTRAYCIEEVSGDYVQLALFSSVTYTDDSDIIEVRLSRTIRPYLFQLKNNFTTFELDMTLSLKSEHSQRIYEMLCQHRNAGVMHITVEKLKYRLSLIDLKTKVERYKAWSSFSKDVLEVAKKEIQNHTNIAFTYTLKKTGQKYTDITFYIRTNPVQTLLDFSI